MMDPVTLIVTALAAGAALGIKDTASTAIKDAYAGLKALAIRRLTGRPDAELVLAKHEKSPEIWQAPLTAELTEANADRDTELVAAAQALMSLLDETGARGNKYTVNLKTAQGVQIGDKNRQSNRFGTPPVGPH